MKRHRLVVGVGLLLCVIVALVAGRPRTDLAGVAGIGPGLRDAHRCTAADVGAGGLIGLAAFVGPGGLRMICGEFTVPLDHGLFPGPRTPGSLTLPVAITDNPAPPRGDLVWLAGGPGQPGVPEAASVAGQLDPSVLRDYRLVLFSGRGTGPNALDCPELQQVMGDSDLVVPPARAVTDCAATLGAARRFYSSADTVEDLDTLRRLLGADRLTIDAASYGTYPAERYAITHPDRVSRLVLDGVVPSDGYDYLLNTTVMQAVGTVLDRVCHQTGCGTDPVADLAAVVARQHDGPRLLDAITGGAPLADVPDALHQAAGGQPAALQAILDQAALDRRTGAGELSQGLHAATECEDQPGPWGDAATDPASRAPALAGAVAATDPRAFYPFDAATATGNGIAVTCLLWPATPVPPATRAAVHATLPPVPTLLLVGSQDLETPVALARHQAGLTPRGRVVVVPAAGHVVQSAGDPPAGRQAATAFLTAPTPEW
jgi:pimeloyl-ACP methyl ester carboxylesterase